MKIPFDIKYRPQIESGEYKVELRDGRPAKIIYWDAKGPTPIVCLYMTDDGSETTVEVRPDGRWSDDPSCEMYDDLFTVIPEEELTEFEEKVKQLIGNYPVATRENKGSLIYEVRKAAAELLSLARKQLQPDIDAEIENVCKNALKDLPRWKKIGRGNNYSSETKFTINGRYLEMNDTLNDVYEAPLSALEKLPKEDSHE